MEGGRERGRREVGEEGRMEGEREGKTERGREGGCRGNRVSFGFHRTCFQNHYKVLIVAREVCSTSPHTIFHNLQKFIFIEHWLM